MCGIAGLISPGCSAAETAALVAQMNATLVHRGPDDEGIFAADGVAIGMRRLSIIDVAGGHQPIANEDGSVCAVLNGEIYNFPDLRAELEKSGHVMATQSDTETIVHAYEESGTDVFSRLRGMFAIALWDARNRRLLLARDRLGKKPLYYAQSAGGFFFASEIKALLAVDPSLSEPDEAAIVPYFQFGFIAGERTAFRRIRKLSAAHWLLWENGHVRIARYWNLDLASSLESIAKSDEDWAGELERILTEAVRIRLMSEVPLGIFLSGGMDSSAVAVLAHESGLRPVRAFTISFDRPAWDESADAASVAARYGMEHHVLLLSEQEMMRSLPDTLDALAAQFDEPFGDSSALPTYYVSRLARQYVTVILSGDGGDELFAGYTSYQGFRFADLYQQCSTASMRRVLPELVSATAGVLPGGQRDGARRAAKVLRDSALPFEDRYVSKMTVTPPPLLASLIEPDVLAMGGAQPALPAHVRDVFNAPLPAVSRLGYADLHFRLVEDMLVKVDRMSMAHSLEVRSPLLDHRLIEFAWTMPARLKLRGWERKALLRDVLRPRLPVRLFAKRKQGFSVPLRDWLRSSLAVTVRDLLIGGASELREGGLRTDAVAALVRSHEQGAADHSQVIWLLLMYATWRRRLTSGH